MCRYLFLCLTLTVFSCPRSTGFTHPCTSVESALRPSAPNSTLQRPDRHFSPITNNKHDIFNIYYHHALLQIPKTKGVSENTTIVSFYYVVHCCWNFQFTKRKNIHVHVIKTCSKYNFLSVIPSALRKCGNINKSTTLNLKKNPAGLIS